MPVAAFVYGVIAYFTLLGDTNREQDQHLYDILVGRFQANVNLLIDPLSICFILLITGVGSLIIIYSVGYMAHDPGLAAVLRCDMNLFIAAMLLLVLADNYLVLYVGWEGVGPGLLPAHRVLAGPELGGGGGEEGVRRQPGR